MKTHHTTQFLPTIPVNGKGTQRILGVKKPISIAIQQNLIGIGQIPIRIHPIPVSI